MKLANIPVLLACAWASTIIAISPPATLAAASNGDKQFLSTAAQSDVNEIKLSQLAVIKAFNPKVESVRT